MPVVEEDVAVAPDLGRQQRAEQQHVGEVQQHALAHAERGGVLGRAARRDVAESVGHSFSGGSPADAATAAEQSGQRRRALRRAQARGVRSMSSRASGAATRRRRAILPYPASGSELGARAVRRSIGIPLALGIVLAILLLALAVGWQILVVGDPRPVTAGLLALDWALLVLGTLFFALVLGGLVWLSAWLIREMRLNQRQRAFLDAVTHEMKTPLASLRLYVDTLTRHDPEPERRRHFLALMQEDLDRIDRTVDQVLAAARAEEPARRVRRGRVRAGGDAARVHPRGARAGTRCPTTSMQLDVPVGPGGARRRRRARRWCSATCSRTP